jgi:hypothetical protein
MHIDSYRFGEMIIDGAHFRSDLILFPDKILAHWWRREDHVLCVQDIDAVISFHPELVIIGTGAQGRMKISRETQQALAEKNIMCSASRTDQAAVFFNKAIEHKRRAAGAFHLTC